MVAITPITNFPQTTSLNGLEVLPAVQTGVTVKIPLQQIATFTINQLGTIDPGVLTWNGRSGAVVLLNSDITGAGGAILASPAFTGTPTVPTASPGTNTTQAASTAFVATSFAPLASPALTGTPTSPTASPGDNTTKIATTAFVTASEAALAPLASPALTGTPTAPTASINTNTTQVATTAFVLANTVSLNSPAFTGGPTAPTPAPNTNTTQLATTAFVVGQASTTTPLVDGSAAIGTSLTYARADHVHPVVTGSFLPLSGGTLTGALTIAQLAGIVGTTTNNNANSGSIGEYVSASQATSISLATTVQTNITSISLTAGDWDVDGFCNMNFSATGSAASCGVSTTSATLSTNLHTIGFSSSAISGVINLPLGTNRLSLSSTTTVYLVAKIVTGNGPFNGGGLLQARRVR